MTTFDSREAAFENQFARDADLQFKVFARRDKLIGLWAADKLGIIGAEADAYAKTVILSDLEEAGDEDIIRKLVADLAKVGIADAEIRTKLAEKHVEARKQIMETL